MPGMAQRRRGRAARVQRQRHWSSASSPTALTSMLVGPALRRDPADAAAPAHALGRAHRAAPVDGLALGAARRDQPGAQRARGLGVVHRLADRLRSRHRVRREPRAAGGDDADLAARRARRRAGAGMGATGSPADEGVAALARGRSPSRRACPRSDATRMPGKPNACRPRAAADRGHGLRRRSTRGNCAGCHGADGTARRFRRPQRSRLSRAGAARAPPPGHRGRRARHGPARLRDRARGAR